MAGGPIQFWREWATQILVLLSFALQIFLFLFASTRRRGPSTVMRILLWLAYLMADSTAVYTLGHLAINGSLREHELVVFWAPFLLVHLGSQDTITAYALEDNQLWPRHLLNLGVQAFGVAYVLYENIAEISTSLGLATGLMFIIGLIKYGERIWALKCATLDSILSSIRESRPLPTYYNKLPSHGARSEERYEEEILLFAQSMLPICKGAMNDFPVAFSVSAFKDDVKVSTAHSWNWNLKDRCKVVEMELSLMYDILYTKAAVIHNWRGYCIRVFSPLGTIVVFILFQLSGNKDDYNRVDVAITYILLVGAFLLDMASVFRTLGSNWACNFLWTRGWSKLGNVIVSLRLHVKAARGNRGWSASMGQFNLLQFCCRDKTKLSTRVAKMIRLEDWWNKWHYSETLVMSGDAKDLVFQRVWQTLKDIHVSEVDNVLLSMLCYESIEEDEEEPTEICMRFTPESYEDTARRRMKVAEALGFSAEEMIFTWHVFTDVFLLCGGTPKDKDATSSTYLEAIKALSNYMIFLIAIRPNMIQSLELRSMYEATREALDKLWISAYCQHEYPLGSRFTREEVLAYALQNGGGKHLSGNSSVILMRGDFYASLLLELVDISKPDKSAIISCYERNDGAAMDKLKLLMPDLESSCRGGVFDMDKALALILDAWVRLLIFTSGRCSRDAHARQINCGGELTTIVWLMQEHAAMFFKSPVDYDYEPDEGNSTRKAYVEIGHSTGYSPTIFRAYDDTIFDSRPELTRLIVTP